MLATHATVGTTVECTDKRRSVRHDTIFNFRFQFQHDELRVEPDKESAMSFVGQQQTTNWNTYTAFT